MLKAYSYLDTPFCWGVWDVVSCLFIPFVLQNCSNSAEVNSPPLSVLKQPILSPFSFFTSALNFLKLSKAADLVARKYTHVILVKSSMKVVKYLLLLFGSRLSGPQISECTNSSLLSCSPSTFLHLTGADLLPCVSELEFLCLTHLSAQICSAKGESSP